jgi:hypothetical protein
LWDKKEIVKVMGIIARLAIIAQKILNIENEKLKLEQSMDLIHDPIFLSFIDPVVWIEIHTLDVRDKIHLLKTWKRALLSEQQSLIMMTALPRSIDVFIFEKKS